MRFRNILRRYGISPLRYEDNKELDEKDYKDLYILLTKYFYIQGNAYELEPELVSKLKNKISLAVIPLTDEEKLDILIGLEKEVL